jgi:delta-aminolevulinic acid dehydratase/porphobilinogen synthase
MQLGQRRVRDGGGGGGDRWIDRNKVIAETLTAIKRAGAGIILTYWATEVAPRLA